MFNRSNDPRIMGFSVYPVKRGKNWYALLSRWRHDWGKQENIWLHRFVVGAKTGTMVCHRNGNGLDCRKNNLFFGNHASNGSSYRHKRSGSASRYRGVHINNGRGKRWTSMFWDHGKVIYLGRFSTQKAAALSYDAEANRRFGKFAHLNFK